MMIIITTILMKIMITIATILIITIIVKMTMIVITITESRDLILLQKSTQNLLKILQYDKAIGCPLGRWVEGPHNQPLYLGDQVNRSLGYRQPTH